MSQCTEAYSVYFIDFLYKPINNFTKFGFNWIWSLIHIWNTTIRICPLWGGILSGNRSSVTPKLLWLISRETADCYGVFWEMSDSQQQQENLLVLVCWIKVWQQQVKKQQTWLITDESKYLSDLWGCSKRKRSSKWGKQGPHNSCLKETKGEACTNQNISVWNVLTVATPLHSIA